MSAPIIPVYKWLALNHRQSISAPHQRYLSLHNIISTSHTLAEYECGINLTNHREKFLIEDLCTSICEDNVKKRFWSSSCPFIVLNYGKLLWRKSCYFSFDIERLCLHVNMAQTKMKTRLVSFIMFCYFVNIICLYCIMIPSAIISLETISFENNSNGKPGLTSVMRNIKCSPLLDDFS